MSNKQKSVLISHNDSNLDASVQEIKERIEKANFSADYNEYLFTLLNQLLESELGQFLISNRGLNGYWTSYIVLYPDNKQKPVNEAERWFLETCPTVIATQERFKIFQKVLNKSINNGMKLASLPCGLMDDLLLLDYSQISDIDLVGIDLDQKSLDQARVVAEKLNLEKHCEFYNYDAWQLPWEAEFDVLVSNGLNVYVHEDQSLQELYKGFYRVLKKGGILVTSFLTPIPGLSGESPWLLDNIDQKSLMLQKIIFSDILNVQWQSFKTEEQVRETLTDIGFRDIEVIYDSNRIFPTVVAYK